MGFIFISGINKFFNLPILFIMIIGVLSFIFLLFARCSYVSHCYPYCSVGQHSFRRFHFCWNYVETVLNFGPPGKKGASLGCIFPGQVTGRNYFSAFFLQIQRFFYMVNTGSMLNYVYFKLD